MRPGARIGRKAWQDACVKAELPGKLPHDLRRTAIRNLLRAGVDPIIVLNISGHRGMSVLERYDMRGEADVIAAAEKLGEYMAAKPKRSKVTRMRRRG